MGILSALFGKRSSEDFKLLVKEGALIVDVRSRGEFAAGHIAGSINIPLDEIRQHVANLKSKNKKMITCCRSGVRSGMAKNILSGQGLVVFNGGAWSSLNKQIQ
ncbi:MAG: rhodanese-like domain-containing protein [Chitinophagaceae bacterium]|nr:rhodanese-like domain-containing protein [Chitinophagaceae bacterium]